MTPTERQELIQTRAKLLAEVARLERLLNLRRVHRCPKCSHQFEKENAIAPSDQERSQEQRPAGASGPV